jgi:hypothetical protein
VLVGASVALGFTLHLGAASPVLRLGFAEASDRHEERAAVTAPAPGVEKPPPAAAAPRIGAAARAHVASDGPLLVAQPAAGPSTAALPPVAEARAPLALGDRAALVDRARAALASGDAATAARLADEYDARFPSGVLAQESTVMRIQALAMRGDLASARALGERFLAANDVSSSPRPSTRRRDRGEPLKNDAHLRPFRARRPPGRHVTS